MNAASKVVINTIVLYAKILVSMAIALISVPLVLKALGASDYGLYNLVAGVVAMLNFLSNSLTVSSQRYMSVAMGTNDEKRINLVYNTSFWLHLLLGFVVVILLEGGSFFIGMLNIEPDRLWCAKIIFQFLILSTFVKIIMVPFDAIINAHEDLVTFAVIELIDSFLMLAIALSLSHIPYDKLFFYGLCVCLIAVLNIIMKFIWCRYKYKRFRINLKKYWGNLLTKEMSGFAGWNLFGGLAIIGRNQGVAIIINLFLGTIANAAYGIANQINGALSQFSSTFQKAINPQLMKSEGMNNRERLLRISYISSKFSVLALGFFALPLIVEMSDVLSVWLGTDIPLYSKELSIFILLLTIVYQYSMGIMSAIQATGNIRNYTITMGCIILLNIPLAYIILKLGYPVYFVTVGYVVLEIVSLVVRIKMAEKIVEMPVSAFYTNVIKPTLLIMLPSLLFCFVPHFFIISLWPRLIITCLVYAVVFLSLLWIVALDKTQREQVLIRIKKLNKH